MEDSCGKKVTDAESEVLHVDLDEEVVLEQRENGGGADGRKTHRYGARVS